MAKVKSLPNRICPSGDRDEVHVIGHQTIGENLQRKSPRIIEKQTEIGLSIRFIEEHGRTPYSSLSDVVRSIHDHDARNSSHGIWDSSTVAVRGQIGRASSLSLKDSRRSRS